MGLGIWRGMWVEREFIDILKQPQDAKFGMRTLYNISLPFVLLANILLMVEFRLILSELKFK